jgi:hypothetical protein
MAPRQCNSNDGDGRHDGNSNSNGMRDGNATSMMAMDSARATAIDGVTATRQCGRRDGNTTGA